MDVSAREIMAWCDRFRTLNVLSLQSLRRHDYLVMHTIQKLEKQYGGNMTISDVAKEMNVFSTAVSRALRGLEQQGLILRRVCPEDRRNTSVTLTESGIRILAEADDILKQFYEGMLKQVSSQDLEQLAMLLERVYAVAQQQLSQMKCEGKGQTEHG